ncbi:cytochrome-c peroxidase [Magnetospira sp. QH-2]|uniref:cytochrome-c peroxidase n=1 Tax=Magnetospira sp. (strain QH-2) TaxID=1288970 RepID=UPI0003E80FEA|nr:cytochrome c peroxidase [Magnetospira sp. QH-2]CCQ72084.1 Cytochrome c peroxidase [Magnetospira sp. QH-2]
MDISLYVTAAAVMGCGVLILVSGELSRRLGLSRTGRMMMAGMLGFGVIGLSIKAVVLLLLQPPASLAAMVEAGQVITPQAQRSTSEGLPLGLTYAGRGKAWRALPVTDIPPQDETQVELGRRLFFDTRLSSSGQVACASCHVIAKGGDDDSATSTGIRNLKGERNAPTVLNAAFLKRLFWDGRAASLEEQAVGPLTNPVEMDLPSLDRAVAIVAADESYRQAFGGTVTIDKIASAIASFERTLITPGSPYDRFVEGDNEALNQSQIRGLMLFDEIGCRGCHPDPWFTVAAQPHASPYRVFPVYRDSPSVARYDLTKDKGLNGSGVWRVPSLRNIDRTAPYFHNGSVEDLEEAVRVMVATQLGREVQSGPAMRPQIVRDEHGRPSVTGRRALTDRDMGDLTAFLRALTGVTPAVVVPGTS